MCNATEELDENKLNMVVNTLPTKHRLECIYNQPPTIALNHIQPSKFS